MSTHVPGFQSFSGISAIYHIGQISHTSMRVEIKHLAM